MGGLDLQGGSLVAAGGGSPQTWGGLASLGWGRGGALNRPLLLNWKEILLGPFLLFEEHSVPYRGKTISGKPESDT